MPVSAMKHTSFHKILCYRDIWGYVIDMHFYLTPGANASSTDSNLTCLYTCEISQTAGGTFKLCTVSEIFYEHTQTRLGMGEHFYILK